MTGGTPQRHMIDRTTRARQLEPIRDLGGDVAFRARYESQHWSHLLIGIASQFLRIDPAPAPAAQIHRLGLTAALSSLSTPGDPQPAFSIAPRADGQPPAQTVRPGAADLGPQQQAGGLAQASVDAMS